MTPISEGWPKIKHGSACCGQGPPTRASRSRRPTIRTASHRILPLAATWDAYLEGLPSKLRHEIKRKARKLEAETGPFRIATATPETLIPFLDRFVELHRMSEGPKGVFMQPGMEIFFRRLGEAFGPRGIFRLTFIEVGGVKAAGHDRVLVRGDVLPVQLGVRQGTATARAGDGSGRRRHPPCHRGRMQGVRSAEG